MRETAQINKITKLTLRSVRLLWFALCSVEVAWLWLQFASILIGSSSLWWSLLALSGLHYVNFRCMSGFGSVIGVCVWRCLTLGFLCGSRRFALCFFAHGCAQIRINCHNTLTYFLKHPHVGYIRSSNLSRHKQWWVPSFVISSIEIAICIKWCSTYPSRHWLFIKDSILLTTKSSR